jgi:hypothetical protein
MTIPKHNGKAISYLRAGFLLHIVTVLEITLFVFLYKIFGIDKWLNQGNLFLKFFILLPFSAMPIFAQLDARSRFQNYKLVKDHLFVYGFQEKILKPFVKSRCQRDAVLAAANELGMGPMCRAYFRIKRYKWFHLFPDVLFHQPKTLLTKNFWSTTFFTKTYHSKIDFRKLKLQSAKDVTSTLKLNKVSKFFATTQNDANLKIR